MEEKQLSRKEVNQMAIDIFGEDRVDLSGDDRRFSIIILFPEINITNSKSERHTIKDLYFKTTVDIRSNPKADEYKAYISTSGTRGRLSIREVSSNYTHSHLPSGAIYGYGQFCLGASDFQVVISQLNMDLSEERWFMYFYSIERYLEWESIEGGPYNSMQNITYQNRVSAGAIQQEALRLVKFIPSNLWEVSNVYSLNVNHPSLYEILNKNTTVKSASSTSSQEVESSCRYWENEINGRRSGLTFKGRTLNVKVENDISGAENQLDKTIFGDFCKYINEDIKRYSKTKQYEQLKQSNKDRIFGKSGTSQQAKVDNHGETAEADKLLAF